MKVTRYVNGKKINKNIDNEFLIKQAIITDTIEMVNHRLKLNKDALKGQINE